MTKASVNPRRYSRGSAALNPEQPLVMYLALTIMPSDLETTTARLEDLAQRYQAAQVDLLTHRRDHGQIVVTISVNIGPAREALRGRSPQVRDGYGFLWDLVKSLYYTSPTFVGPPHALPEHEDATTVSSPALLAA